MDETLTLTAGNTDSTITEKSINPIWQIFEQDRLEHCFLRCREDLFARHIVPVIPLTEGNVATHCLFKEDTHLREIVDSFTDPAGGKGGQWIFAERDYASGWVVQFCQQSSKCRFSGAGGADDVCDISGGEID